MKTSNHISNSTASSATNEIQTPLEIDAVILWVDGDDPAHRAKRLKYLEDTNFHQEGMIETRFRSIGEIDYCAISILKFAPFIRKIHIITDAQTPPILKRLHHLPREWQKKLHLVDHSTIFEGYEAHLPTFNSVSIESVMHRIPGLAEHFIEFNDDLFLIRQTTPEDFFIQGLPLHRGNWRKQPFIKELKRRIKKKVFTKIGRKYTLTPSFTRAQMNAARMAGYHYNFFRADHTPKPLRKSQIEGFFNKRVSVLEKNISHRSREASQFHLPSLACHLEFMHGTGLETENLALLYIKPEKLSRETVGEMLEKAESDSSIMFACFQSLDDAPMEHVRTILNWLDRILEKEAHFDLASHSAEDDTLRPNHQRA